MKLWLTLGLCLPLCVSATNVIVDTGKTVSAIKYRHDIGQQQPPPARPGVGEFVSPRTPEMTVGRVNARKVNLPYLPNPLFLIGTDKTSQAWLNKHANALKKAGAKGLIINSDSPNALKRTIQAGQGVQLSPASGTELAKRFKLRHYPVLITRQQIAQ